MKDIFLLQPLDVPVKLTHTKPAPQLYSNFSNFPRWLKIAVPTVTTTALGIFAYQMNSGSNVNGKSVKIGDNFSFQADNFSFQAMLIGMAASVSTTYLIRKCYLKSREILRRRSPQPPKELLRCAENVGKESFSLPAKKPSLCMTLRSFFDPNPKVRQHQFERQQFLTTLGIVSNLADRFTIQEMRITYVSGILMYERLIDQASLAFVALGTSHCEAEETIPLASVMERIPLTTINQASYVSDSLEEFAHRENEDSDDISKRSFRSPSDVLKVCRGVRINQNDHPGTIFEVPPQSITAIHARAKRQWLRVSQSGASASSSDWHFQIP